jgi:hypothetical protein
MGKEGKRWQVFRHISDRLRYPGGRTWPEVKHLMGEDMGEMMSGAFDAAASTIWIHLVICCHGSHGP